MDTEAAARIAYLEQRIARIEQHLGITALLDPGAAGLVSTEVVALVRAGKKIDAIKMYREQTGMGLKEAKDVIDAL